MTSFAVDGDVENVERRAGVGRVDGVEFPSADDGIFPRIQARGVLAAFAKGKLVDDAGDVVELHVEARRPVLRCQVVNVLRIGLVVARVIFKRLLGISQGSAPREGVQEIESVGEAMFDASGKSVVVIVAHWIDPGDGSKRRDRAAGLNAERSARRIGIRLIVVAEDREDSDCGCRCKPTQPRCSSGSSRCTDRNQFCT